MGVPALFRWLSKKYPKIIYPVEEEEGINVPDAEGNLVPIPIDISHPNPNGTEFDNLYLDMNGIVHPCTHPEGKPAPETEEDMMIEVFKYTERIVAMVRPRKLLFMAIDGVAPRAKMNQQRSRRFRTAQETKDKENARREAVAMWEAMGKELSEEEKVKESWDSNAITPGTPFMDLLALSLRYWVVHKINTDPGWKQVQVIISDASVPGEGEHKIMDFIRRQRTNPGHDPNTRHVIYGLDADLIMLALATHEPHFRVLREDVFFTDGSSTACRTCGQEGHYAAQCTGVKAEIKKTPVEKKPFIFLDVAILREYLEVELNVPQSSFPFNLEKAIDDWVLLIFFVGNDFLPHLPSLEIREGAIDTLLRIWKQEISRMGGYLTNHGQINLSRAQILLEGLAKREDEIFRRRREAEERQEQNAKRRKLEIQQDKNGGSTGPSPALRLTAPTTAPSITPVHPSLPQRPAYDFVATADSIGLGAPPTTQSIQNIPAAVQALAGSNHDVVANRRAIRMANMSAGEILKAELFGLAPVKPDLSLPPKPVSSDTSLTMRSVHTSGSVLEATRMSMDLQPDFNEAPGSGAYATAEDMASENTLVEEDLDADGEPDPDISSASNDVSRESPRGTKRKHEETVEDMEDGLSDDDDVPAESLALKVNPDGTVEQEDKVRLWEPGYMERYYRQKFGVELSDTSFRTELMKKYVEGLVWVLHYYYQGTPSWQWYYPYHFAPFAADFIEVDKINIKFEIGQPFKPFEQLMGVFPAASRKHIPKTFQSLMVDEDSPIIDFYPSTFEIDMNGKKLAWQGVALLPFIDEKRLLQAMEPQYPELSEEENRRNRWGDNVMFASDEHPLYPFFEQLFGKRKKQDPVPVDTTLSKGISGAVLPNPDCLPGSTYYCPLTSKDLPDIKNDKSLSVLYLCPKKLCPHQSVLLPGVKPPPRILSSADLEAIKYGVRRPARGGWDRGRGRDNGHNTSHLRPPIQPPGFYGYERPYNGHGGNSYQPNPYSSQPSRPPYPTHTYGAYSSNAGPPQYGGSYGPSNRGFTPSRGRDQDRNSYGSYRGGYESGNHGQYGGYGSNYASAANRYGYQTAARGSHTFNSLRGRGRGRWQ